MIRAYQFLDIFRLVILYNDDIVMQVILSLLGDTEYLLGRLNKSGRFDGVQSTVVKAKIYSTIHYSHIYLYIRLTRMFSSQKQPAMRHNTLKDLLPLLATELRYSGFLNPEDALK
jgi:hypothetical protein